MKIILLLSLDEILAKMKELQISYQMTSHLKESRLLAPNTLLCFSSMMISI